ncbi:hypothetical protein WIW50_15610 [Flavobacteriaceae bacterium 3-367]|uniref:hypothetical protein n=1 Tax=Eudoraea algarum TaxID=3417568 RepID=UPI00328CDC73
MRNIKLIIVLLAFNIPIIISAQSKVKKDFVVQEFVKDRDDWKPNLGSSEIMILENGYAIGGYDPVAYFKQNKAQKGFASIKVEWNDATWLFLRGA